MKNKILVVGNGFDLYHKLPTRYTDFLFLAKKWEGLEKGITYHVNDDSNIFTVYNVRLNDYGSLTLESLDDFAKMTHFHQKDIDFLSNQFKQNKWIQYFIKENYQSEKWIDFENEIDTVLHRIDKYFSELPNAVGNRTVLYFDKLILKTFELLSITIPTHITRNDIIPEIIQEQKNKIIHNLKLELDDLIRCLHIYLNQFVLHIRSNFHSEQINVLNPTHLLNFNYTYTFKSIYGTQELLGHHQIHGSLADKDIVLGINDDSFDNLDYIYFQKYFQRIQKRTGSYYKEWISQKTKNSSECFIFGHSLDKTDQSIFNDIFKSDVVQKIHIYFHNQHAYESQVINLINMFGKDFVIQQVATERIVFIKLNSATNKS